MADPVTIKEPKTATKPERPKLWKVILLNDDFTPRDFVVAVLRRVFRMSEGEAMSVMMAAHEQGAAVVAVFTKEVADEKARIATEAGEMRGYPLTFTTEKED